MRYRAEIGCGLITCCKVCIPQVSLKSKGVLIFGDLARNYSIIIIAKFLSRVYITGAWTRHILVKFAAKELV